MTQAGSLGENFECDHPPSIQAMFKVMELSKGVFCRVRVCSVGYEILYRTYRIIGYRYENRTETTERSGTGMRILQELQNLSGTVWNAYRKPVPVVGYLSKYIPAPRVRVNILYKSHRTVGYG